MWGHNELTTTVEVRPDGMITFPLVGDQLEAGRTTQDLAGDIQQELWAYVIEPHVTVLVNQFRTVGVQVLGGEVLAITKSGLTRLMDASAWQGPTGADL